MKHILPAAAAHSSIFRVATLVLAIGIFGFDTFTLLEAAAAVLYVVVVLMSDGFCHRRGILFVAGGCMGLTVLSVMLTIAGYPATAAGSPIVGGVINLFISLMAIAATTSPVSTTESAETAKHEARTQLAHIARVTTLGEMTASIAHEVSQPLAAVVSSGNAGLRWLANAPQS